MEQTPFDITNHSDLSPFSDEPEGSLETMDIASLLARTVTVVLTMLGGILLVAKIIKRRRGSSTEASIVITVQFIWQVRSSRVMSNPQLFIWTRGEQVVGGSRLNGLTKKCRSKMRRYFLYCGEINQQT